MRINAYSSIKFELLLSVVLFRLNIFSNLYFIKNFIRVGGCEINGIVVTHPYRVLKLGDIVSINKKFFKVIFNKLILMYYISTKYKHSIWYRQIKEEKLRFWLTCPKLILPPPLYIEVNYKILHAVV